MANEYIEKNHARYQRNAFRILEASVSKIGLYINENIRVKGWSRYEPLTTIFV